VQRLDAGALPNERLLRQRYDLSPGCAYLVRPDQHIAARWKAPSIDRINRALARATGGR
jgi:3-(3-hydroxy-phenyl)propionate hydroxylase